jgi:PAS domain S-box-containing protein
VTLFVGQASNLKRQRASQAAGFAALAIATMAYIGRWVSLPLLSSWGSGFATVKPTTALCLIALGLALVHPGKSSRLAFAISLAVVAIAALDLIDRFGIDSGINSLNRLLVPLAAVPGPETSFRTMNGVPLAVAFAGGSLALSRFEGHHFAATALGGLAGVMQVFALLTYLGGIHILYGSVGQPTPPTAVGLLCVASGIILRIGAMPALRKPRPLWHLLIMLGCAIIAPLLLFGVFTGIRVTDEQLRDVRNELMSETRTLSAAIDREIVGEIERLQTLAASPSLQQGDFAAFQRQAEASLALRQSGNIMLIDRNMQQLVNTWVHFGTPMEKTAIPESVERALVTGKPHVTGLGPETPQVMFAVIMPVQIDGENRYALVRSPDQHALAGLIAATELRPGWQAAVSDAAHRIIVQSDQQDALTGKDPPQAQWHRKEPGGVFEFIDSEGRPSLQAYTWSELTGWETAVWASTSLLEAPVRALWWTISLTAVLTFALVVALASWLGRIVARSVGHAARAAIALGKGGPLPSDETPVAEVDTLLAELRGAAARRQATEDLLRDSEARFRAMFEVSSVGKIETECETGRFLRANAAMCALVGYSEEELLATTAWDITHPDERDRDREPIRRLLVGELPVFDVEKRYMRRDGTAVWVRVTANVIRDPSGRPLRSMAVIQDLTTRKQAEQELEASKDRLQLAFDAARLGWWQYDPPRRMGWGDARFKEIFDVTADEIPIEDLIKRVHPDDAERFWADREAALDPADPKPYAHEYRIVRRDGAVRWVEGHGLAYFVGAGRERWAVSLGGTVQDITERKEREEKEHLLMREINHRAKNMLSVVDAIAHQTATRSPEDFVERFSARVQALSANQDLLVQSEWKGIELADLVRAQLAHLADLIGARIAVQGPRRRLNPAAAQAIGLALHELATNAGKYGALSTDTGHVDVSWGSDGDTLTMSWSERRGPPVSVPTRRGFGTIVMEAMAERSVGGNVDLDYAPSGVTWRLTCPAANALADGDNDYGAGPSEAEAKPGN